MVKQIIVQVVFCKYAVTLNAWLFPNTRQRVSEMCRHNGQSEIEKKCMDLERDN